MTDTCEENYQAILSSNDMWAKVWAVAAGWLHVLLFAVQVCDTQNAFCPLRDSIVSYYGPRQTWNLSTSTKVQ
jgi:predicted membrane protein